MKRKKIETIEFDEDFEIPQIPIPLDCLIKGKSKFSPSETVSPIHGRNVVDKISYVDNSGKVDIDYGYDFIRDKKHISDEEQIRRHGTKYYEFSFLNDQLSDEAKAGANYNQKKKPEQQVMKVNTTLNSFFVNPDEIEEEEEEPVVVPEKVVVPQDQEDELPPMDEDIDLENPDSEFKIHLSVDEEEDTYTYATLDQNLPKPKPTVIPSYVTSDIEDNEPPVYIRPKQEEQPVQLENIEYDDEEPSIDEEIREIVDEQPTKTVVDERLELQAKPIQKKPKYDNYSIPYEKLFMKSDPTTEEIPAWLEEKKEVINQSLEAFGIDGEVVNYTKGPAFTRYEVMLAANVNVKKINGIFDNLQMALQATSLRIQAPIPGKNTVGIEVPNVKADMVNFGDVLTDDYISSKKNLMVAMGKNIAGEAVFQNIIDMPHALIAGATKSGKSVCINTILVSLLIKNSPEQLKLILVDPKKVELAFYNNLPHLATPVIDDAVIATEALKWAVDEMERRYSILFNAKVRNIEDYNKKRQTRPELENLPFIVIVVDEFNDLVMQCGVEANDAIIRLAQKARAAGIHIILATQRPTVNVVNGTIKSNITCRIAFRVASDQDSRIILDEQGAENLLGRGDMLIKNNGLPERVQGAYISDSEIADVCEYLCDRYEPDFLFTHEDLRKKAMRQSSGGAGGGRESTQEPEELIYQIALYCVESGMCSINSIQNNFGVGFNRASRIVSILEERNIVSPKNGTKGREILVDSYQLRQMFDSIL